MTKSAFWRVSALLFAGLLVIPMLVPSVAQATEAKHAALAGSVLISTTAELDAFAHKASGMDNFAELTTGDYTDGDGGDDGQARIVFSVNESFKIQARANNSAFLGSVRNYAWMGTVFSSSYGFSSDIHQIFDIDLISTNWSIGVSLAQERDDHNEDPGITDDESRDGVSVRASYGSENFDLAGEFSMDNSESSFDDGTTSTTSKDDISMFTAFGKYYSNNWTYCGAIGYDTRDFEADENPSITRAMASLGYNFRDDADGTVVGELFVDYTSWKDQGGTAGNDRTEIMIPGAKVAVDHALNDWLRMYVGAYSYYNVFKDSTDEPDEEWKGRDYDFGWIAGMGATFRGVQVDAVVDTDNLDQVASVGNHEPLIAMISAKVGI